MRIRATSFLYMVFTLYLSSDRSAVIVDQRVNFSNFNAHFRLTS